MARARQDILTAWLREEQHLLDAAPGLRTAIQRVQAETREELARAQSHRDGELRAASTEIAFRRARREIRRLCRTHREQIRRLDLTRWSHLARECGRGAPSPASARDEARRAVARWRPTGIGAASIASLSAYETFVQARARVIAAERDRGTSRER